MIDALLAAGDLGFDALNAGWMWPRHASTEELHPAIIKLGADAHDPTLDDHATSLYTVSKHHHLSQSFSRLERGKLSASDQLQLKRDIAASMRNTVNPEARKIKGLQSDIDRKIGKLDAMRARDSVLGAEDLEKLEKLHQCRSILKSLSEMLVQQQNRFKKLDNDYQIFTGGERFRRNACDFGSAAWRVYSNHRIKIISTVTALLVCSTIAAYLKRSK